MGPGDLAQILDGLKLRSDPNVLIGWDRGDDAGVYRLTDELALVQTVDFFTPIVDDPRAFGRIAAANALSDVYAMGGRPLSALNIVGFPLGTLPAEVLRETLAGGLEKLDEAECALLGGHSIKDPEFKYGLAITGLVHPRRVFEKTGPRVGDALILTKPLGTGVVGSAIKRGRADDETVAAAVRCMEQLNQAAAAAVAELDVHACSDVTGFGFAGHALQMLEGARADFEIVLGDVPWIDGAPALYLGGVAPGGLATNRAHHGARVDVDPGCDEQVALLFDPQTSGGLLLSLPEDDARGALEHMHGEGVAAARVGTVVEGSGRLRVLP